MSPDVFHAGERAVQARAGLRALADRVGRSIGDSLPPAAQAFIEDRRWVVVAGLDAADRPWASVLAGGPGLVEAIDDRTLRLDARPTEGDPLAAVLGPGAPIGVLAIDLATRRRLRLNGHVAAAGAAHLVIAANEVYANCPKHIQRREPAIGEPPAGGVATRAADLSDAQRAWLRGADTFFIATGAPGLGVDASHRGGMPGFVRVAGRRIVWPDYAGNALFNTLGNIEAWPYAGLLVPDFETGAVLQLTGRAAIDWNEDHAAEIPGAERLVTLDVEQVVEIPGAFPTALRLREYSPANPR